MNPTPGKEQRRTPRVPHHFMARYQPEPAGKSGWMVSPLHDLSSGGARFISEHAFQPGDVAVLQLLLPSLRSPVLLRARVAWTKPAHLRMVEIGVTFDCGDRSIQHAIDAAVAHFLKESERSR